MKNYEIENHLDFLFSAALSKCGKLYDGDYDNDDPCVHQAPQPMILIIDK